MDYNKRIPTLLWSGGYLLQTGDFIRRTYGDVLPKLFGKVIIKAGNAAAFAGGTGVFEDEL